MEFKGCLLNVSILNMQGQEVYQRDLAHTKEINSIAVSNLPKGNYILQIATEQETISKKIIKQ